jgi:hypothetical protein
MSGDHNQYQKPTCKDSLQIEGEEHMISYSTNWMGPINAKWIAEHGEHWSAGRIDIYGTDDAYPEEMGLPTMHTEDWNCFGDWLNSFQTDEIWDLDRLVAEYQKTNPPIRWHKERK